MDLYKTLEVQKGASKEDIKKSYRKLAKQYHPDKNPNNDDAERRFKEINAAYDILKDDEKRAAYDQFGEAAFNGGAGGPGQNPFGGGFNFEFSGGSGLSDIFEDLFGGFGGSAGQRQKQRAKAQTRGSDLRYNLEISLEEAFEGEKKTINYDTFVGCQKCNGKGSADSKEPGECSTCDGTGIAYVQQGFMSIGRTCPECQGTGSVIVNPCKTCRGEGRVKKQKSLSVTIPKGVEEGTRIRLSGEGEEGLRSGEPGDLYLFISLKPHQIFMREGDDIHTKAPIKFTTAALGGTMEVPTVDGARARITIPPGTQTGHQFRLKGKGMPKMRASTRFGDMYVHASVETPMNLSAKQKELLEMFEKQSDVKNSPETEGFLRKIKDYLKRTEG